jgi:hypothetical protein
MQPASAHASPKLGSPANSELPCPKCTHGNPADSKFCGACGAPLRAAAESKAEAPDLRLAAELFKPLPRRHPRMIMHAVAIGTVAAAALGALAYYLHDNFFYADFSSAYVGAKPAAESGADAGPGAHRAGAIGRDAAQPPEPARPIQAEKAARPAAAAAPRTPVASAVRAPRQPAAARKATERRLPRTEPCTASIAALGLCSPRPGQAPQAKAAAAAGPAVAFPREGAAGEAVQREQPRAAPCTEGVAALGLCTPTSTLKKE